MKQIKITLDSLWSQAVKVRDHYKCQYCRLTGTESHHLISRRHKIVRWRLENGICLCSSCHRQATEHKVESAIPWEIRQLSRQAAKFSSEQLNEIKAELRAVIKEG